MKLTFFVGGLIFLILPCWAYESRDGNKIMDLLRPAVFQIKTSVSATAQKNSYGTGFVVEKSGILATNFHVVANAVTNEDEFFQVYLVDKNQSLEGKIVGIDVIHDLALIKVNRTFEKQLSFASDYPKQGESIFSVGLPEDVNMSIITGIYNSLSKNGAINESSHLSAPLNHGMSGGPTVNDKGEVIGVNVSTLYNSQNISFAVPLQYLKNLIQENKKNNYKELSHDVLLEIISRQLTRGQSDLLEELKTAPKAKLDLPGWRIFSPPQTIRCWGNKTTDKKKTVELDSQMCSLQRHIFLEKNISTTYYEFSFNSLKNKKRNRFQFYNFLNNSNYNYFEKLEATAWKEPQCFQSTIMNVNKIPFRLNGCLSSFKRSYGKGLYRGVFQALSLLQDDEALAFHFKMVGFSKEGIKDALQMQINSISKR